MASWQDARRSGLGPSPHSLRKRPLPVATEPTGRPGDIARIHIVPPPERRRFILQLTSCLVTFGEPLHKVHEKVLHAAAFLAAPVEPAMFDLAIVLAYENQDGEPIRQEFVQCPSGLSLHRLQLVHGVYWEVMKDRLSASDGILALQRAASDQPWLSTCEGLLWGFLAGLAVASMGFAGSLLDGLLSGLMSAAVWLHQAKLGNKKPFSGTTEIALAALISILARLLEAIALHSVCYSAVSSAAIVLILPGFEVLQGSLELASKNTSSGATKLISAVVHALFLGYSLQLGSDLVFWSVPSIQQGRQQVLAAMRASESVIGSIAYANGTIVEHRRGIFVFQQTFDPDQSLNGCPSDPGYPWYSRPLAWPFLFLTVPLFVLSLARLNGQTWSGWRIWVMVLFGCCSFAANKVGNSILFGEGDIVTALGATIVGILGSICGRLAHVDPLPSMVPGILVLLPAGLSTVGGLSSNYPSAKDSALASMQTAIRMIQVTIGITIGLFSSTAIVHAAMQITNILTGRRPRNALRVASSTAL